MRGLLKNLLLLTVVAMLASGCAGMKKRRGGGGGGGDGLPRDGGGGGGGGNRGNESAQLRAAQEAVQLANDQRDELQRNLDEVLANQNRVFVENGTAGQNIDPNRFVVPGQSPLPGFDPNVQTGSPFETGGPQVPLSPTGQPQVLEAGVDPLIQVGNPTAALRSSATRRPAARGLASHN